MPGDLLPAELVELALTGQRRGLVGRGQPRSCSCFPVPSLWSWSLPLLGHLLLVVQVLPLAFVPVLAFQLEPRVPGPLLGQLLLRFLEELAHLEDVIVLLPQLLVVPFGHPLRRQHLDAGHHDLQPVDQRRAHRLVGGELVVNRVPHLVDLLNGVVQPHLHHVVVAEQVTGEQLLRVLQALADDDKRIHHGAAEGDPDGEGLRLLGRDAELGR